eukprot:867702-Rhodomonas_salina.2
MRGGGPGCKSSCNPPKSKHCGKMTARSESTPSTAGWGRSIALHSASSNNAGMMKAPDTTRSLRQCLKRPERASVIDYQQIFSRARNRKQEEQEEGGSPMLCR